MTFLSCWIRNPLWVGTLNLTGRSLVGNQRDRVRPIASGLWFPSEFTLLLDLLSVVSWPLNRLYWPLPASAFQICQDKNCTHLTGSLEDCFWSDESRAPPTPSATALVVMGGCSATLVVTVLIKCQAPGICGTGMPEGWGSCQCHVCSPLSRLL